MTHYLDSNHSHRVSCATAMLLHHETRISLASTVPRIDVTNVSSYVIPRTLRESLAPFIGGNGNEQKHDRRRQGFQRQFECRHHLHFLTGNRSSCDPTLSGSISQSNNEQSGFCTERIYSSKSNETRKSRSLASATVVVVLPRRFHIQYGRKTDYSTKRKDRRLTDVRISQVNNIPSPRSVNPALPTGFTRGTPARTPPETLRDGKMAITESHCRAPFRHSAIPSILVSNNILLHPQHIRLDSLWNWERTMIYSYFLFSISATSALTDLCCLPGPCPLLSFCRCLCLSFCLLSSSCRLLSCSRRLCSSFSFLSSPCLFITNSRLL